MPGLTPPQHRSSRSTPACSPRPMSTPRAPRSGSWSRSVWTSASPPTFIRERRREGDAIVSRSAVREIQGIGRFKFGEGELEQFKRLSAQLMEVVRSKDSGTLQYEIYFNDDQSECIVLERYRDSDALV